MKTYSKISHKERVLIEGDIELYLKGDTRVVDIMKKRNVTGNTVITIAHQMITQKAAKSQQEKENHYVEPSLTKTPEGARVIIGVPTIEDVEKLMKIDKTLTTKQAVLKLTAI